LATEEDSAMTAPREEGDGVWRDPERLPLAELDQALAQYSTEGQMDDLTGGDAGAEAEFGHEPVVNAASASAAGDPDPDTEEGRRLRPSFEGRSGPS
jgi:hypothetical protein